MSTMIADKGENIYGALKLIEQLFHDGEISEVVFRNILKEYKGVVPMENFNASGNNANGQREEKRCTDTD